MTKDVRIVVHLPEKGAWALAQIIKRICTADLKSLAADEAEADLAYWDGLIKVRDALAEAGVSPR